ncbi:MAG: HPr family phosphocarrier protein [Eubacteriales bacterium]|nr:HPr family phosphocarrier protein [Eubacteriales bacterium]
MLEKKIRLNAVNDVTEFVRAAEKCQFDVDVFYNRMTIDAKSILGVMSMDLTKTLTVKYAKEDRSIERVLNKFAIA